MRMRLLTPLLGRKERKIAYTDFKDEVVGVRDDPPSTNLRGGGPGGVFSGKEEVNNLFDKVSDLNRAGAVERKGGSCW